MNKFLETLDVGELVRWTVPLIAFCVLVVQVTNCTERDSTLRSETIRGLAAAGCEDWDVDSRLGGEVTCRTWREVNDVRPLHRHSEVEAQD